MKQAIAIGLMTVGLWSWPTMAGAQSASEYRQQGLSYREQAQYPAAITAFQQAVALEPASLPSRVLLGWTQHRAGQHAAAAETLFHAWLLDPFYVPTSNALGIVYLVQEDLAAAIATHTWAAMLQPKNEVAYYNLSLALQRLGWPDGAITAAQEAAQLEPSNPHPLVAEAIAHWSKGDINQAEVAYGRALALDPRYSDPAFLSDLATAGFNLRQIQLTEQVRQQRQLSP